MRSLAGSLPACTIRVWSSLGALVSQAAECCGSCSRHALKEALPPGRTPNVPLHRSRSKQRVLQPQVSSPLLFNEPAAKFAVLS